MKSLRLHSKLFNLKNYIHAEHQENKRNMYYLIQCTFAIMLCFFFSNASQGAGDLEALAFEQQNHIMLSKPFVHSDGYVYFQGELNKLQRVSAEDGSELQQISGNFTLSPPFVDKDYVYFHGTDHKLIRVDKESKHPAERFENGDNDIFSSPFVYEEYVYFQGKDNGLYRVKKDPATKDNPVRIRDNTTASAPFVEGGYVYFHGTDDQNGLYRVDIEGKSATTRVGGNCGTLSTPFVDGDYVYHQGTENGLWRIKKDADDRSSLVNIGSNTTFSTPFVDRDYVYFQGVNNRLYRTKKNSPSNETGALNIEWNLTKSTPVVSGDYVYFQGIYDKLIKRAIHNWFNLYVGFYTAVPLCQPGQSLKLNLTGGLVSQIAGTSNMQKLNGSAEISGQGLSIASWFSKTTRMRNVQEFKDDRTVFRQGLSMTSSIRISGDPFFDPSQEYSPYEYRALWQVAYSSDDGTQTGSTQFEYDYIFPPASSSPNQPPQPPHSVALINTQPSTQINTSRAYNLGAIQQKVFFGNGNDVYIIFNLSA